MFQKSAKDKKITFSMSSVKFQKKHLYHQKHFNNNGVQISKKLTRLKVFLSRHLKLAYLVLSILILKKIEILFIHSQKQRRSIAHLLVENN